MPGSSGMAGSSDRDRVKNVAETTQAFITLMDALKLNLRAKDQLHPLLGEAVSCWNRSGGAIGRNDGNDEVMGGRREKLVGWLITLNQLKASDEIDADQARQVSRSITEATLRSLLLTRRPSELLLRCCLISKAHIKHGSGACKGAEQELVAELLITKD